MLAGGLLDRIRGLLKSEYQNASDFKDRTVYFRHESEGRLQCEVHVYFPPAMVHIAKLFDAIPCGKPAQNSLGVLMGPADLQR